MSEKELLAWVCDYLVRQCLQLEEEGKMIIDEICKVIGGKDGCI